MRSYSCAALSAIAHYAEFSPNAPALIEPDGKSFSYSEICVQMEALSRRLKEAGAGFGERVAVLLPQGTQQVLAVAGALNHHIAIPLQTKTTAAELESSLRRLAASTLITSSEYETEAAVKMGLTVLIARDGELPQDWEIKSSAFTSSQLSNSSGAILLLITSATTGRSKIVPLTGVNLDAGIGSRRQSLQLTASDRLLLMTPLCHIIGVENVLAQLSVGGTVIATRGFDPAAYLHWLNHMRPTWYDCAPTVHHAALAQMKSGSIDLPVSLRFVQSAGAPLPNDVKQGLEQILRLPVYSDYGMTEACPIAVDAFRSGDRVTNSVGRSCGLQIGIMHLSGSLFQRVQKAKSWYAAQPCSRAMRAMPKPTAMPFRTAGSGPAMQDVWIRMGTCL